MTDVLASETGLPERVFVRNHRAELDWVTATIVEVLEPVMYIMKTESGQRWKRHADKMKEWLLPPHSLITPESEVRDSYVFITTILCNIMLKLFPAKSDVVNCATIVDSLSQVPQTSNSFFCSSTIDTYLGQGHQ